MPVCNKCQKWKSESYFESIGFASLGYDEYDGRPERICTDCQKKADHEELIAA